MAVDVGPASEVRMEPAGSQGCSAQWWSLRADKQFFARLQEGRSGMAFPSFLHMTQSSF